jgi:LysM repeat protein
VFGDDTVMHRTHVRRRRTLVAVVCLVASLASLGPITGAVAAPETPVQPVVSQRYVVAPGDTLWAIATTVAQGRDPRAVVYQIERVNGVEADSLAPGQVLVIPAG